MIMWQDCRAESRSKEGLPVTLELDKYSPSLSSFRTGDRASCVSSEDAGASRSQCHSSAETGSAQWGSEL